MTVFEDDDGKLRNGWACCLHFVRVYKAGGWFSGVHLVFHALTVVLDCEFIAQEDFMQRFDETHPGESMFDIVTAAVAGGRKPLTLA